MNWIDLVLSRLSLYLLANFYTMSLNHDMTMKVKERMCKARDCALCYCITAKPYSHKVAPQFMTYHLQKGQTGNLSFPQVLYKRLHPGNGGIWKATEDCNRRNCIKSTSEICQYWTRKSCADNGAPESDHTSGELYKQLAKVRFLFDYMYEISDHSEAKFQCSGGLWQRIFS
jgi:hypothetical protein